MDAGLIALAGTVCGGVGLKLADHFLGKNKVKNDDASQIRDELRLEITAQREDIRKLESDVDKWREDYYSLRDKYVSLQTELTLALEKIKVEAVVAAERASELEQEPPETPTLDGGGVR